MKRLDEAEKGIGDSTPLTTPAPNGATTLMHTPATGQGLRLYSLNKNPGVNPGFCLMEHKGFVLLAINELSGAVLSKVHDSISK